jgi:hypothetical protein
MKNIRVNSSHSRHSRSINRTRINTNATNDHEFYLRKSAF